MNFPAQAGQVRSFETNSGSVIFVVVAHTYLKANLCEVILLGLNPDDATERDFRKYADGLDLPFAVSIFSDYTGAIEMRDLSKGHLIGRLCSMCVGYICDQSFRGIAPFAYSLYPRHKCFEPGSYNLASRQNYIKYKEDEYQQFWDATIKYEDYDEMINSRTARYTPLYTSTKEMMKSVSSAELRKLQIEWNDLPLTKRLVRA